MALRTCEHIKMDGNRCGAAALRDNNYCYYHHRYHDPADRPATGSASYRLPVYEDSRSIILSIHQAVSAYLAGTINAEGCKLMLYAAQVTLSAMRRNDACSPEEQQARELIEQQREEARLKLAQAKLEVQAARRKAQKEEEEKEEEPDRAVELLELLLDKLDELEVEDEQQQAELPITTTDH